MFLRIQLPMHKHPTMDWGWDENAIGIITAQNR